MTFSYRLLNNWRASAGRPAMTYMHQLCVNPRYSLADLPGEMDNRDGCREIKRTPLYQHDLIIIIILIMKRRIIVYFLYGIFFILLGMLDPFFHLLHIVLYLLPLSILIIHWLLISEPLRRKKKYEIPLDGINRFIFMLYII